MLKIGSFLFVFSVSLSLFPAHSQAQESGLTIGNFLQITPNIYRGGRPTSADLSALIQQYHMHTDIDLEDDTSVVSAEKNTAKSLSLQFLSTPIDPYTTPTDAEVNGVLAQMQDPNNFPIFLHCHYGDDRTGLLAALYRVEVQEWTPAAAYSEMLADGFHTVLVGLDNYFRKRTGYTGN